MRRLIVGVCLVMLALVLAGMTKTGDELTGTLGYTTWNCQDGRPLGWIRLDVLGSEEEASTIAHEQDHIDLMSQYTCYEWAQLSRDRDFMLTAEARGFCRSAEVALNEGRFPDLATAVEHYAGWLSTGYTFGLSRQQAYDEIARVCLEEDT